MFKKLFVPKPVTQETIDYIDLSNKPSLQHLKSSLIQNRSLGIELDKTISYSPNDNIVTLNERTNNLLFWDGSNADSMLNKIQIIKK